MNIFTGTHLITEIVDLVLHDGDVIRSKNISQHERWGFLEAFPAPYNIYNVDEMTPPRIIRTHIPHEILSKSIIEDSKIIYLARNPKDVVTSFYFFHKHNTDVKNFNENFSQFFSRFLNDATLYSPYSNHVKAFWNNRHRENVLFMFYEDILNDPIGSIRAVASFLNKNISDESVQNISKYIDFNNMKNISRNQLASGQEKRLNVDVFYRKGRIGSWKEMFSAQQSILMDNWIAKNFEETDIKFKFS
ncbi:Sulfotransferase 1C2 [Nymphon striatum]|nr:Sulfotransferase 1C2 [Nymphon striatum]